jgi:glycosyltransferase involved in cell wall biosynthesis
MTLTYNLGMNELPLVSIVTPSYNQGAFLEETMRSVLEQDYPKIEYWVIDGGSTDNSVDIIKSHQQRLTGWVSEKDRGQADGINKGFAKATGEIVGWLNSDDLYYPGAIREAVAAFQAHPEASFVFSDVESIDGEGKAFNLMRYGDWKLADLMAFNIIGQPGVFMRREVLEQAGYLDLSYNYLLDVQLWLKMARIAEPFYAPDKVWAAARLHEKAKNAAQVSGFGPEAFRLAKWLCEDEAYYPLNAQNFNKIWAGAHRLNAFYQVEAQNYGDALRSYARMLRFQPKQPLQTYRRMIFALLGWLGLGKLRKPYERLRENSYLRKQSKNGNGHD